MVYGCIPVRVGSQLRGLCQSPCHAGWGWRVTGAKCPHLPFPHSIEWQRFPEVDERKFAEVPLATLQTMFRSITAELKSRIRQSMFQTQLGWIYGWGDTVTSKEFGEATEYVWQSIVSTVL